MSKIDLSENDLYYLRSIKRNLQELHEIAREIALYSLGSDALADNLDWLDCFIARVER